MYYFLFQLTPDLLLEESADRFVRQLWWTPKPFSVTNLSNTPLFEVTKYELFLRYRIGKNNETHTNQKYCAICNVS
jgi:hypothetical protein